jgi:hypothetical protein
MTHRSRMLGLFLPNAPDVPSSALLRVTFVVLHGALRRTCSLSTAIVRTWRDFFEVQTKRSVT